MMGKTFVVGGFVYIALIVIFLGGTTGVPTNNINGLSEKIEDFDEELVLLLDAIPATATEY